MHFRLAAIAALTSALALPAFATTHYISPLGATASASPTGAIDRPWSSVEAAIASGKVLGGDTLLLKAGNHGPLVVRNANFATPVTIGSEVEKNAHVDYIMVRELARNVVIQNLSVWPTNPYAPDSSLIYTWDNASYITLKGLDVRAGEDAANFPNWSATEWAKRATDGANILSEFTTVSSSSFTGVKFGIQMLGDDGRVTGNTVNGFSGDGMRGNGDRGIFRANTIKNCVVINDNHPDGFQAFTDTAITGLTFERNTILEWSHATVSPVRCGLQGVGLFDGFYDNLTIRNNIISVSLPHGLAVYGARNAVITNNTVVSANGKPGTYPWIGVFDHKNGKPSTDVTVANNISLKFSGTTNTANRVLFTDNAAITDPAKVFENVAAYDYHLKAGSPYIDKANMVYAPPVDRTRLMRPYGAGPDMGAYEMNSVLATAAAPAPTSKTAAKVTTASLATAPETGSDGSADAAAPVTTTADATPTTTSGGTGAKFVRPVKK